MIIAGDRNTSSTMLWCTQSIVQPVPTRHRRHACIKMRTALPANTRTWPNVVSMLVQRRWRWANIETALGQILAFAELHTGVVYTHPSPTIIFSPADQGTFSKTAGQSQAYYNTWNWEQGTYDVNHLHILTCEIAVSRVSSVALMFSAKFSVNHHTIFPKFHRRSYIQVGLMKFEVEKPVNLMAEVGHIWRSKQFKNWPLKLTIQSTKK